MEPIYECCICKRGIVSGENAEHRLDPCVIVLTSNYNAPPEQQRTQQFWCHTECFRRVVNRDRVMYILDKDFPTQGEVDSDRPEAGR